MTGDDRFATPRPDQIIGTGARSQNAPAIAALIDGLRHFGIGYSWGGFESLAIPVDPGNYRTATRPDFAGPLVRLQIGLEDSDDLIADLAAGLERFAAVRG